MAFAQNWVESDPDGSVITVSTLDNWTRMTKVAVRERMEGDPALNLTGLIEAGSWVAAPMPKAGSARVSAVTAANLGTVPLQDGRLAVTTDTNRMYHMKGAGYVELDYLSKAGGGNVSGAVSFTGAAGSLSSINDATINGLTIGRGNTDINGNTALGAATLAAVGAAGVANTAVGFAAMQNNIDAPGNVAVGFGAMGSFLTGNGANVAVGYQSGSAHTTATQNAAVGYWALRSTTTGSNNSALGYRAGMSIVSANYGTYVGYAVFDAPCGDQNTGIGGFAGTQNTGSNNTIGGYFSFKSSTSGNNNTTWGATTLRDNVNGSNNLALGYFAGAYALGSNEFYLDNQDRGSTANDKAKAMFYGVFNAAPAAQTLVINAATTVSQTLAVTGTITSTGTITGTLATAAQPNITSLGSLTSLSVSGGGITSAGSIVQNGAAGDNQIQGRIRFTGLWSGANGNGTISQHVSHGILVNTIAGSVNDFNLTATSFNSIMRVPTGTQTTVFAAGMTISTGGLTVSAGGIAVTGGITGTISTAAQPNITSVGTLTTLAVTGALSAGATTVTSLIGLTATTLGAPTANTATLATIGGAGSPVATQAQAKWLPITGSDALVYYVPAWR